MDMNNVAICLKVMCIYTCNAESKRMDTGLSLDTIDQNATNDQSGL